MALNLPPELLAAQKAEGKSTDIEIVAVNDLTDNASLAHLLKFDSILGRLPYDVSLEGDDTIVVGDHKIKALEVKEGPSALPWGERPHPAPCWRTCSRGRPPGNRRSHRCDCRWACEIRAGSAFLFR